MESKKVSKKLNTIIWYMIYALPLLFLLIYFVGYLAIYKETGVVPEVSIFESVVGSVNNFFSGFTWDFIKESLTNTFDVIGFNMTGDVTQFVLIYFTWFIQFVFIHIFIDFLLFIPRFFHDVFERWS